METVKTGFIEITSHDPGFCSVLSVRHTRSSASSLPNELGGTQIFLDLGMPIGENRKRRPNQRRYIYTYEKNRVVLSPFVSVVTYLAVVQSL